MDCPNQDNQFQLAHAALLVDSYRRLVGSELFPAADSVTTDALGKRLFEAPFVVVSHDTASDPIFNYGNQTALKLFEMNWSEFTKLPSRKSAEPMNRYDRARLLAAVTEQQFIDDYSGVRISATGKRFHLPKAIVWNVIDEQGKKHGQAATFSQWQYLSG